MKTFRPLFFFAVVLLVVGLACSAFGDGGAQPQPTQPPVQQKPTQPPPPAPTDTTAPQPTQPPAATDTPEPQVQQFFTEEFDNPLANDWDILTVTGSDTADPDKVTVDAQDGKLVWNFDSDNVYYYLFYNAFNYEDVRVDVRADNRGKNNNSISLICRYDPEVGWYEFNIANNGLYNIIYAEVTKSGDISYNTIVDGGSNAIKQGKDVNEYGISCKGDNLTLYINGKEVKSLTEKNYRLREGQVGMSVSSFATLPIIIEMDWFKVSEP
jgi:hypothetical protein